MNLLLDTHTVFWSLIEPQKLSSQARQAIASSANDVCVSTASLWEMAIKVGLGKWPEAASLVTNFELEMQTVKFSVLSISILHARQAGLMTAAHRDPFDRLLAAQAMIEGLTLVTSDSRMAPLGAAVLW